MAEATRLYLITPPVVDAAAFAPLLESAVAAADVACVLIRTGARDEHGAKAIVRALAPLAQRHGAAALVEDRRLAVRLDLDGAHVAGTGEALDEALAALKPDRIVGVGALAGRDAAMTAGETGVDYLMFGSPGHPERPPETRDDAHAAVCEAVAWWSDIFNVPCVGYAAHPDLAADVAAAGAEFVALCDGLWDRPDAIAATLAAVTQTIATTAIAQVPEVVR